MNQSTMNMSSKCVNVPENVRLYHNEKQRTKAQVPQSTATHNAVCNSQVGRRNKLRYQTDNMLDRKNKVRARLQEKLKKKLKNKKSN